MTHTVHHIVRLLLLSSGLLALALGLCPRARAEQDEIALGASVGLLFPGFSPASDVSFALTTWQVSVLATYGVLPDLSLTASFSFTTFSARAADVLVEQDGLEYLGTLHFATRWYHPRVGARYKLVAGYGLAPYLELSAGYLWSTLHSPRLMNQEHRQYALGLSDFAEGLVTLTAGLSVDFRLFDLATLGLGFSICWPLQKGLLGHVFSIPVLATTYW